MLALAGVWFVAPLFAEPLAWGSTRDWGYFFFLEEVSRKTLLEFAQFPLWNPYYFGGAEHLANPQSTVLSPTTLLTTLLGTALGLKVGVAVFVALGLSGMYRLARHLGTERSGACIAALIYGCSGWFAQHVGGGHWGFAAVSLYPWAAWSFLAGLDDRRWLLLSLGCSVWVAFHWGVYTLPWLFLVLFAFALGEAARRRSAWPLAAFAGVALFTVGLAAVRLGPVLEYVHRFPRRTTDVDRLGVDDLLRALLSRRTARAVPGHPWEWPEYGNYLGWVPALLLLFSGRTRFPRRAMLWTCAAVCLALALGDWGPYAPYALLRRLPLFQYLRVPSRYTGVALVFLAPLAGLTWSTLERRIRNLGGRSWVAPALAAAVTLGILADPVSFNRRQFEQSFHLPPPTDAISPAFEQRRGDPSRMYAYPRCNQGSVLGLEESPLPLSPWLMISSGPQYGLVDASGARVDETFWSPNRLGYSVETPIPDLMVVNQNYRAEWHEDSGLRVESYRGLLAVRVPPGRHLVHLTYLPASVLGGLLVSLACAGLVALLAWRLRAGTST